MNHVYRLVWNPTLQALVAVCESARGRGKSGGKAARTQALLASVLLAASAMPALAVDMNVLPSGGQVSAGAASISSTANTLTVQQSTQKAAINWQSFSVGGNATVNFQQPNASSVILNRVVGTEQSVIAGAMNANGQVFLLNSNGVLFTGTSSVNVGGLVASTLNVSDADFMAGRNTFTANGSKASVINLGTINAADGGYVALLGNQVKNEGVISARLGTAILAAGDQVSLNFNGDSLVGVTIDQGTLNALVENKQAIYADGGLVVLTAKGLDAVMATVVNNTGEVRAQTIADKEGKIYLLGGMDNNRTEVGGTLDASAPNGGNGGFVETSAASVSVANGTRVTTNAPSGRSGKWLIDPTDFAIDAGTGVQTGSGMGVETLRNNLGSSDIDIYVGSFGNFSGAPDQISFNSSLITNADLGSDRTLTLRVNGKITFGNGVGIDATQGGNTKKLNLVLWTDQGTNSFGDASVTLSDTTVIKTNNGHLWIGGSPMSGMATDTWNNLTVGSGWASRSENSGPAAGIVLGSANIDTGSGDIKLRGQSQAWTSASSCQTDCEAITSTVGGVLRTTGSLVIDAAFAGGGRVLNMGGEILVGGGTTLNFVNNTEGGYWPYRIQLDNPANTLVNPATVNDGLDPAGFIYTVGPLPVDSSPIYLRLTGGGSSVYGSTPSFGYAFYDAASAGTAVTNASPTGTVTWSGAPTSSDSAGIYSLTYSSGITLGNSAFTLSPGSAVSWTVSPAPLTVTARNVSKVYGQTPTLTAYSVSGLQNSETIGSASLSSSGTVATAGVTGSPYRIIASAATGGTFDARNYSITYVNGNLTVSAAPLTITASNASKVYGQTPTLSSFTSSALQNSETIGSVTETSTGSAVTAGVAGSPYSIVASAATGGTFAPGNYSISYVNGDLAVTPLAIAVATNTGATRVYDGTTNAASSLLNVTNAINGDTVSLGGSTTLVGANAGTETVSGMGGLTTSNPNYTVVGGTARGSVAVSAAPMTVTASNASKVYGQAPTLTGFTASGLVAGQTIGSVTETSTGAAASAGVTGSPYGIVASTATGGTFAPGNYSISYVNGNLTVTPLPVAIATVAGATREYDGTANATVDLLTVTNAVNGDTVTLVGNATLAASTVGSEALASIAGISLNNPNYTVAGGAVNGSVMLSLPQAAIANTATQVPANRSATNYPSLTLPAQVSTSTAAGDRPADSIVNVVNPLPQITAAFGPNTTLTVISSPNASEPSQVVSLSQVRNMLQSSSQGGGTPAQAGIPQDVRVPVSRNSLADIVNGGVRLPDGVEQELFVVQAN